MGWQGRQMLRSIPTKELLADVNNNLRQQVWLSVSLIGLMLPLGWLAGRRVGRSLFGLALRQTLGLVESLLRLAGLDWPVPDYSTVCRRQKTLQAQITYRPSAEPLQLLVDKGAARRVRRGTRRAGGRFNRARGRTPPSGSATPARAP